jgi:hypothetical protein
VAAELAAGHDGQADLIVSLRFDNGRVSRVTLDTVAGLRLMRNCGATQYSELVGHSWRGILEGISCST